MTRLQGWVIAVLVVGGCGEGPYGPPPVPVHDQVEEGHLHARGHKSPFMCWSEDFAERVDCPQEPPPLARRSCDSAGCHGSFEYGGTPLELRGLDGDKAPSCFTCHDDEWNEEDD